tara:strand:- start:6271 stop:6531 length:261 start_codon:yes stop_codon:yes gene_type:complete
MNTKTKNSNGRGCGKKLKWIVSFDFNEGNKSVLYFKNMKEISNYLKCSTNKIIYYTRKTGKLFKNSYKKCSLHNSYRNLSIERLMI